MKKYLFFVCSIAFFSCRKTLVVKESFDENGTGWPYYIVRHPIETLTNSLVGEFTFDAKMYAAIGQSIDGNHGVDTVYFVTAPVPLSPAQADEHFDKRGFKLAGVGYLLGAAREYADLFKRQYRFLAAGSTGNLSTFYGGTSTVIKNVMLYTAINGPPTLWCLTSNAAPNTQTEYACFRKR